MKLKRMYESDTDEYSLIVTGFTVAIDGDYNAGDIDGTTIDDYTYTDDLENSIEKTFSKVKVPASLKSLVKTFEFDDMDLSEDPFEAYFYVEVTPDFNYAEDKDTVTHALEQEVASLDGTKLDVGDLHVDQAPDPEPDYDNHDNYFNNDAGLDGYLDVGNIDSTLEAE